MKPVAVVLQQEKDAKGSFQYDVRGIRREAKTNKISYVDDDSCEVIQ